MGATRRREPTATPAWRLTLKSAQLLERKHIIVFFYFFFFHFKIFFIWLTLYISLWIRKFKKFHVTRTKENSFAVFWTVLSQSVGYTRDVISWYLALFLPGWTPQRRWHLIGPRNFWPLFWPLRMRTIGSKQGVFWISTDACDGFIKCTSSPHSSFTLVLVLKPPLDRSFGGVKFSSKYIFL